MIKMCANCGEQHKYVDCPFTEDKIRKEDYEKLRKDSEQLHGTEIMLKRCQELGIEDAQKLERIDSLFTELEIPPPYDLWLSNSLKDRQIVKRLEDEIDGLIEYAYTNDNCQKVNYMNSKYYCDCLFCIFYGELQGILDGKK